MAVQRQPEGGTGGRLGIDHRQPLLLGLGMADVQRLDVRGLHVAGRQAEGAAAGGRRQGQRLPLGGARGPLGGGAQRHPGVRLADARRQQDQRRGVHHHVQHRAEHALGEGRGLDLLPEALVAVVLLAQVEGRGRAAHVAVDLAGAAAAAVVVRQAHAVAEADRLRAVGRGVVGVPLQGVAGLGVAVAGAHREHVVGLHVGRVARVDAQRAAHAGAALHAGREPGVHQLGLRRAGHQVGSHHQARRSGAGVGRGGVVHARLQVRRHGGGEVGIAGDVQRAGGDARARGRGVLGAGVAHQRVQRLLAQPRRLPAQAVVGQHHAGGEHVAVGRGGVDGLDGGAVVRAQRQVALGGEVAVGDGGAGLRQHRVGGDQAVDGQAARHGQRVVDRGDGAGEHGADGGVVARRHAHVAAARQHHVVQRRIDGLRHLVAHRRAADGGQAAAAGQAHGGVDLGLVLGLHRQGAAHAQRQRAGAAGRGRRGLRGVADPGLGAAAGTVGGGHEAGAAEEAGVVVGRDAGRLGGGHGGLHRDVAGHVQRRADDRGQRGHGLLGAEVRPHELVQRGAVQRQPVPAQAVEGEHLAHGRAPLGRGAVVGADAAAVARADRQVAGAVDAPALHQRRGTAQHAVACQDGALRHEAGLQGADAAELSVERGLEREGLVGAHGHAGAAGEREAVETGLDLVARVVACRQQARGRELARAVERAVCLEHRAVAGPDLQRAAHVGGVAAVGRALCAGLDLHLAGVLHQGRRHTGAAAGRTQAQPGVTQQRQLGLHGQAAAHGHLAVAQQGLHLESVGGVGGRRQQRVDAALEHAACGVADAVVGQRRGRVAAPEAARHRHGVVGLERGLLRGLESDVAVDGQRRAVQLCLDRPVEPVRGHRAAVGQRAPAGEGAALLALEVPAGRGLGRRRVQRLHLQRAGLDRERAAGLRAHPCQQRAREVVEHEHAAAAGVVEVQRANAGLDGRAVPGRNRHAAVGLHAGGAAAVVDAGARLGAHAVAGHQGRGPHAQQLRRLGIAGRRAAGAGAGLQRQRRLGVQRHRGRADRGVAQRRQHLEGRAWVLGLAAAQVRQRQCGAAAFAPAHHVAGQGLALRRVRQRRAAGYGGGEAAGGPGTRGQRARQRQRRVGDLQRDAAVELVPGALGADAHVLGQHAAHDRTQVRRHDAGAQHLVRLGEGAQPCGIGLHAVQAHRHRGLDLVAGPSGADGGGALQRRRVAAAGGGVAGSVLRQHRHHAARVHGGVAQQRRNGGAAAVERQAAGAVHAGTRQRQHVQARHVQERAIGRGGDPVSHLVALLAREGPGHVASHAAAGPVAEVGADLQGGRGAARVAAHRGQAAAVAHLRQGRAVQLDEHAHARRVAAGGLRAQRDDAAQLRGAGGLHQHLRHRRHAGLCRDQHLRVAQQRRLAALQRLQAQRALLGAGDLRHQPHVGVGGQHQAGGLDRARTAHHRARVRVGHQRLVHLRPAPHALQLDHRARCQRRLALGDQRAQHLDAGLGRGLGRAFGPLADARLRGQQHVAVGAQGLVLHHLDALGLHRQARGAKVGVLEHHPVAAATAAQAELEEGLGEDQVVQSVAGDAHAAVGLGGDAHQVVTAAQVQHQAGHLLVQAQQVAVGRRQQRRVLLRAAAEVDHRGPGQAVRQGPGQRPLGAGLQHDLLRRQRQAALGVARLPHHRIGRHQHPVFQPFHAGARDPVQAVAGLKGAESVLDGLFHGARLLVWGGRRGLHGARRQREVLGAGVGVQGQEALSVGAGARGEPAQLARADAGQQLVQKAAVQPPASGQQGQLVPEVIGTQATVVKADGTGGAGRALLVRQQQGGVEAGARAGERALQRGGGAGQGGAYIVRAAADPVQQGHGRLGACQRPAPVVGGAQPRRALGAGDRPRGVRVQRPLPAAHLQRRARPGLGTGAGHRHRDRPFQVQLGHQPGTALLHGQEHLVAIRQAGREGLRRRLGQPQARGQRRQRRARPGGRQAPQQPGGLGARGREAARHLETRGLVALRRLGEERPQRMPARRQAGRPGPGRQVGAAAAQVSARHGPFPARLRGAPSAAASPGGRRSTPASPAGAARTAVRPTARPGAAR